MKEAPMSQAQPIVYVVDDNESFLKAVGPAIRAGGYDVETYVSAHDFLTHLNPSQGGCLVLDVRMPSMSGLELQARLADVESHLAIIIVTGHGDVSMAVEAMKQGAFDFIEKPFRNSILLDRIEKALEQQRRTSDQSRELKAFKQRLSLLTRRERQVMDHVAQGKLNKTIAHDLGISEKTVKNHRASVMEKLQVDSLAQLVRHLTEMQLS